VREHLERFSLREDFANLAHRNATVDPANNAAHCRNIGHRVQSMPAIGALGLDQAVSTLPGPERYRVDTG